jgi:hypothetical protein
VAEVIVHEQDRDPSIGPPIAEIDPPLDGDPVLAGHGGTLRIVKASQKNMFAVVAVTSTAIETAVPDAKVLEHTVMKLVQVFTTEPSTLNLIVPVTALSLIAPVGVTFSVYFGTVVVVVDVVDVVDVVVVDATVVVVVVAGTVVVVVGTVVVLVLFAKNGPISISTICLYIG